MTKNEIFQFIAFRLEKRGQPKGDNPTLYGINKRWHPKEYEEIENADATDNPLIIQDTVLKVYNDMFENSIAKYFESYYPLWVNIFDTEFNKGTGDAVLCWQWTVNALAPTHLKPDGIWGKHSKDSLYLLKTLPIRLWNETYSLQRAKNYALTSKKAWVDGLINRVIRLQEHIIKTEED